MSRTFVDDMPLILDHGSSDPRKRAKTEGGGLTTMPAITEHGMESRYGTEQFPFINNKSVPDYAMESDNAIDSAAVNPVVTTILMFEPASAIDTSPKQYHRGQIITLTKSTTASDDYNHENMTYWETAAGDGTVMILAEDVTINRGGYKVVSIAVYGPVLVNIEVGDKNFEICSNDTDIGRIGSTTYDSRMPSGHQNPGHILAQGATYRVVNRNNVKNFRMITYASEGPVVGSHYVILHPTVNCTPSKTGPVYGVHDIDV